MSRRFPFSRQRPAPRPARGPPSASRRGGETLRPAPRSPASAAPRESSAWGDGALREPLFSPPCASEAASGTPILSPRGRSPTGVTPDFRSRPPTPPAGRQPQPRGRTRREYPQVGLSHTLNFSHRPGPQTSATRSRPPGRYSHGHGRAASTADLCFLSRAPRPRSTAPRARASAHPVGGPHLGLLVSTLPLTSGTTPALRAPRGGWNPGDLAVVAEAVEACLLSPWKPPDARSRRGLHGASPPRGRPAPQLPPAERPRRPRKPSWSPVRSPLDPRPEHPETVARGAHFPFPQPA